MPLFSHVHVLATSFLLLALTAVPSGTLARGAAQPCFPGQGACISGRFRTYWEQNGGLPVFGYALRPARPERDPDTGRTYLTQWFERARFELHPEHARPYDVLLGRLGDERLRQLGRDWRTLPRAAPSTPHYFKETGHAVAPQFWAYWRSHGLELGDANVTEREALALFGYPISEPQMETNSSGDRVLTQWFERARFEYHPNNPAAYRVLLGRLGAELRSERGR